MTARSVVWGWSGMGPRAPEDTLVSYWGALGEGAEGLAIPVRLTADHVPVCCPDATLARTTGDPREVATLTSEQLRTLDAGALFRAAGSGGPSPWRGNPRKRDWLHHPSLHEVLLQFAGRTRFLLRLHAAKAQAEDLARGVVAETERFGLGPLCLFAGDPAPLAVLRNLDRKTTITRVQPPLAAVRGVAERLPPRRLLLDDPLKNGAVDRMHWTLGFSRPNRDTAISLNGALSFTLQDGGSYSGAAAVTSFPVRGDFDAQVSFRVHRPAQGTTFELAAIQIDPGPHRVSNAKLDRKSVHLTFDVHGAPPYASSERDEDDGFRIGWNNGPAILQVQGGLPQSLNAYNKYGRDVGDGSGANPAGRLRLTRCGDIFNAYYSDKHNPNWVLSGSVAVPPLAREVYLRLGAKHWPKGGRKPPPNRVDWTDFKLYQR